MIPRHREIGVGLIGKTCRLGKTGSPDHLAVTLIRLAAALTRSPSVAPPLITGGLVIPTSDSEL